MKRISVFVIILSLLTGCTHHITPTKSVQVEKPVPVESIIWEEMRLTEEKKNNLALLGKIWGYLKYYHPTVAKGEIDWDQELVNMIPKVLQAEDTEERDRIFTKWIDGLGEYKKKGKLANWVAGLKTEDYKQQPNLEWISTSGLDTELAKKLTDLKEANRGDENHYIRMDRFGKLNVDNEKPYAEMRYPEVEYRLLSLFRYWNIIEYYFPYKYLIDENWDDVLVEFIPKFLEAANEQEYQLTTLEMIARIQDTHATYTYAFGIDKFWGLRYAPVILTFVENKPVVTGYYDKVLGQQSGLKVGDVITKINDKTIEEIIEETQKYIPASNDPTQLRILSDKLLRSNDDKIDIEFFRDDKLQETTLDTYSSERLKIARYNPLQKLQKDRFKKIYSDIIYFGSLREEYVPFIMKESKDTKGLIIDLRTGQLEYNAIFSLADYLLPTRKEFVKISKGSIQDPGLFPITNSMKVGSARAHNWVNPFYYKGKVVILINENTQSMGEFASMALRVAPDAIVIGSTTAGTDGDVFNLSLPGGIQTKITGLGIYYPDGSQTQRIGIIPDIEVKPTVQGIKEGRDEVLERAVQLINENSLSDK